jgi:hypothetical protein
VERVIATHAVLLELLGFEKRVTIGDEAGALVLEPRTVLSLGLTV